MYVSIFCGHVGVIIFSMVVLMRLNLVKLDFDIDTFSHFAASAGTLDKRLSCFLSPSYPIIRVHGPHSRYLIFWLLLRSLKYRCYGMWAQASRLQFPCNKLCCFLQPVLKWHLGLSVDISTRRFFACTVFVSLAWQGSVSIYIAGVMSERATINRSGPKTVLWDTTLVVTVVLERAHLMPYLGFRYEVM